MKNIPLSEPHPTSSFAPPAVMPPLREGDHLDQPTFHKRYEAMQPAVRAELIGGIVFMPCRVNQPHSHMHGRVMHWLFGYQDATPQTMPLDNASAILDEHSEPQPDACLLITAPQYRQTRDEHGCIVGAPEFILEIAHGIESIDLHRKRDDYERAGVREYVVVTLDPPRVYWFTRCDAAFADLAPGADGTYRSEVFPGLWLDPQALLQLDSNRILEVLQQGLASPEHAAFVDKLSRPAAS
jgi:hypothetical protein